MEGTNFVVILRSSGFFLKFHFIFLESATAQCMCPDNKNITPRVRGGGEVSLAILSPDYDLALY